MTWGKEWEKGDKKEDPIYDLITAVIISVSSVMAFSPQSCLRAIKDFLTAGNLISQVREPGGTGLAHGAH